MEMGRVWTSGMLAVLVSASSGAALPATAPPAAAAQLRAQATDPDAAALERAAALNEQLIELYQAGRYQDAIPLAEEALAIRREQLGERHPDVADSLNNLALLYEGQGRYGEAEPLHNKALAIRREQLGERHPDVADSLSNLASLYLVQGRYREAEPLFIEALAIYPEQLGERHPNVATTRNNLAELYRAQGRYGEAEPLHQEALAIRREQLGEHHPDVADSLNNLALLYLAQGQYREAEPLFIEALAIYSEQLGDRHPAVATTLNNLALLYQGQGRYGEAERLHNEALAIRREQLGERHPDVADSLNNLASLYLAQGQYREAETLIIEALAIYPEQLGARHPNVATSLNILAELYRAQRRYGEAERLHNEALAIRRERLGERHPDVATSLNSLALLYQGQGRYGEAEPTYKESLAIYQERLGARHPNVAQILINLAALHLIQSHPQEMVRSFQEALAIEEWQLELNLTTLTESQRQDYAATLLDTTSGVISVSLQITEAKSLGLTTLLRRKGRLLEAGSSSLQRLRQNLTSEDQTVLDRFITVSQQLATLTFNPPPNLPLEEYRAQLAQLEREYVDLEKTLARRSDVFRIETQPVELATVQAQIPVDGVLVEYVRYWPVDVKAEPSDRFGNPRYAAYLLFPDGRIEAIDLGDAATIDTAISAFIQLLQDRRTDFQRAGAAPALRPDVVEGITENIKTLVFDPIAPYLQDVDHLLISPDGQLNRLPFEALQAEAGGEYLVQQYQISYLNSGRDLLKFDVIEPSRNPDVLIANPNYQTVDDTLQLAQAPYRGLSDNRRSAELSQLQVASLPGTAAEVEAIQPLLPNATILTTDQATENALKQVRFPRILHIATHGYFFAEHGSHPYRYPDH